MRAVALAVLAALAAAAPASASLESCVYDPVTKSIAATITAGSQATLKVTPSGELLFGATPASCTTFPAV